MIGIVDYGMGNLLSVYNAFVAIGEDVKICQNPDDLVNMSHIVLPGVGSFNKCMSNILDRGFYGILNDLALNEKRPILGICLGMQLMTNNSTEGRSCKGFEWIDSEVTRIELKKEIKIPHIGWNSLDVCNDSLLLTGLSNEPDFYYVHSYQMKCTGDEDVIATCNYGQKITSIVNKDNIYGVQFHPEKSQDNGLILLENFAAIRQC